MKRVIAFFRRAWAGYLALLKERPHCPTEAATGICPHELEDDE